MDHPEYPRPKPQTLFRVFGPETINGMRQWKILCARTGRQVGPPCFSIEEAEQRVRELLVGKQVYWFGHHKFTPKKL